MDAEPEVRQVGRYWLFRPLASGGAATVYLGCLRSPGGFSRAVAIKKLHTNCAHDPRHVAALIDEGRIASRIRHPNVVSVLDVVVEKGETLLVLDYVHGESLSQLLDARPARAPVPLPVAVRIVVDALEGLHAAHEATNDQGVPLLVVHRDVSPQNIMVDEEGRARIVDFGIAKALERPFTTVKTDEFRGKLAYASPEQLAGEKIDRRTDVWAAGVVLWELVAGRRIFEDAAPPEIMHRILRVTPPPPSSANPGCSAAIDAVVAQALSLDPDLRFASAREMALALEKAGPAADHREVSRWLRSLARSRLRERRELLQEMESALRDRPGGDTDSAVVATASTASLGPRRRSLSRHALVAIAVVVAAGVSVGAVALAGAVRGGGASPSASLATQATEAPPAPIPAASATEPALPTVSPTSEAAPSHTPTPARAVRLPDKRPKSASPRGQVARSGAAAGAGDPLGLDERK